jgi:hypothetical protein
LFASSELPGRVEERVTAFEILGRVQYLTDASVRTEVRSALLHQFGLDIRVVVDGAGT